MVQRHHSFRVHELMSVAEACDVPPPLCAPDELAAFLAAQGTFLTVTLRAEYPTVTAVISLGQSAG